MPTKKILTPIDLYGIYHIYNRGNNFENVFFKESDYHLFLRKFKKYVYPITRLYAYVLLPNHYHFLLKVNINNTNQYFSKQYLKFILSYTNTINKIKHRSGNLFLPVFKRLLVSNEDYLRHLIYYIHHNPESHKIVNDYKLYKFSSYRAYIENKPTLIKKEEILEYFGGIEGFIDFHNMNHEVNNLRNLMME